MPRRATTTATKTKTDSRKRKSAKSTTTTFQAVLLSLLLPCMYMHLVRESLSEGEAYFPSSVFFSAYIGLRTIFVFFFSS